MKIADAAMFMVFAFILFICFSTAHAQDHAMFHDHYVGWVNGVDKGCCNNADCSPIPDTRVRIRNGRLEVFIVGVHSAAGKSEWCPVLPFHYLKKGNAPDASTNHACVTEYYGGTTPCAQFICYQPKPMT